MKKIVYTSIVLLVSAGLFYGFCFYVFHDYPNTFVVTSKNMDEDNQYFLNGVLVGNSKGFCITVRDEERTEIMLVNNTKKQSVLLTKVPKSLNIWRFIISEPVGDNLGLEIIRANANQELRMEVGCAR